MLPQFFRNRRIFGNANVLSEIFGLLLLVKIKVLNFIGKSFNLPPPLRYRCHDASGTDIIQARTVTDVT